MSLLAGAGQLQDAGSCDSHMKKSASTVYGSLLDRRKVYDIKTQGGSIPSHFLNRCSMHKFLFIQ